jgi:hypothetical protein
MNDYELGTNLRRQLLADQQRGIRQDPRRLQALASDFCADQQLALLPAVKYLLLTPAFNQVLEQRPALPSDPQLVLQLQQELDAVFAPAVSRRTGNVLRGLLALPAASAPTLAPAPDPAPAPAPAPAPPVPLAPRSGSRGLLVLLSFMAGVLVVGVVGALAWLLQLNRAGQHLLPQPLSETPQPAKPPTPPIQALTPPPAPGLEQLELERAIATVQQLYSALSSGDSGAARRLFSGEAADQFDPNFFSQFSRVSVADLVETGRSGSTVNLTGLVTFTYPDGTSQVESRTFSVDTATEPGLITASSFQAVMQPR